MQTFKGNSTFFTQQILSGGQTCKLYLALDQDGKKYAQKQFINPKRQIKVIQHEIQILKQLNHKHINKLEHYGHDNLYLEFLENGDLFKTIQKQPLSEQKAKIYFKQLVETLIYLHYEKNIAHRDIKLENIMLDGNNDIKLCDFGYSINYLKGEKLKEFIGTENYMSPQIVQKIEYDPEKSDIFALGIVLFSMLMGFPPYLKYASETNPHYKFFKLNKQEAYWAALQKKMNFIIPNQFIDLVNKMLEYNEINRPNLQDILVHPWLTQEGWL